MPRLAPDQAEGLRRLFVEDVRRMIALVDCVDSDKGSGFSSRLAVLLARQGKKVLLLDETLSAGKLHAVLSVTPKYDIGDVLHESIDVEEAIFHTSSHVDLLAGEESPSSLTRPTINARMGLVNAFYRLAGRYDVVLVNTRSGSVQHRPSLTWACQDVILHCDAEAVMHAYARIKMLHQAGERRFHLLFSNVEEVSAEALFRRVASVSHRHLKLIPGFLGVTPTEDGADTGLFYSRLAQQVQTWPLPEHEAGYFPTLMRRLLRNSRSHAIHM